MNYWGVVPAAGSGTRMNSACPKQYLRIHGHYVLDYCLAALLSYAGIRKVVISIETDTPYWEASAYSREARVAVCAGGVLRAHSVLNALHRLADAADDADWILVHDAVRPCLAHKELGRLAETLKDDAVGGILAAPVVDAVKRCDASAYVAETLERRHLYRALTPQMFRYRLLYEALNAALEQGFEVMDEAQAMELAGHKIRVLESHAVNMKITRSDDLALAACYLSGRPELESLVRQTEIR